MSLALRVWNANCGLLTFFLPDDDDDLPAPLIRAFSLPVPLPPLLPAASLQSFSPL